MTPAKQVTVEIRIGIARLTGAGSGPAAGLRGYFFTGVTGGALYFRSTMSLPGP